MALNPEKVAASKAALPAQIKHISTHYPYIGEVVGTGLLGGMLAYPIAAFLMGNETAALFTFVVPFLISTCGGTIIAIVFTAALKKTGLIAKWKDEVDREASQNLK